MGTRLKWEWRTRSASGEDLPYRIRPLIDDANGAADVGVVLAGRVDAQGAAGGGQEVQDGDAAFLDGRAVPAGAADDLPAADAAARKYRGPGIRIVVAARGGIDPRRA